MIKLDVIGAANGKASLETYTSPVIQTCFMFRTVPGSERYYCRAEDCKNFTWANVPCGYCNDHLLRHLQGEVFAEKPLPPVGTIMKQEGFAHDA